MLWLFYSSMSFPKVVITLKYILKHQYQIKA